MKSISCSLWNRKYTKCISRKTDTSNVGNFSFSFFDFQERFTGTFHESKFEHNFFLEKNGEYGEKLKFLFISEGSTLEDISKHNRHLKYSQFCQSKSSMFLLFQYLFKAFCFHEKLFFWKFTVAENSIMHLSRCTGSLR